MLTTSNRFFARYSYQKTHRVLPATLPHGDAGFTFGAGDGNIKAQGLAFNDTHTFSVELAERVPLRLELDQVLHDADRLRHEPGADRRHPGRQPGDDDVGDEPDRCSTTAACANLGANGNQPLITNQNDFQIFDNVTRVAGKHTIKAGGSLTLRSREILNADTIVGQFDFNQNQTSNCAGITAGCTVLANTGFDVASFLLGYASNASRTLFDPGTYTETRPEYAALLPGRHPRRPTA